MIATALDIVSTIEPMLTGKLNEEEMLQQLEEFTVDRIDGQQLAHGARIMQRLMIPIILTGNPIDCCGTGGSGKRRINTSTLVAFIVAAAGGRVAKHGNRASSGHCGSFDLLEGLGAKIELSPLQERKVFDELGIVFLFAPLHHPGMKFAREVRRKFGKKTLFNLLGPVCNPANVRTQLIGVSDQKEAKIMADAFTHLGTSGLVVSGNDGLDEVTLNGATTIQKIPGEEYAFEPSDLGIQNFCAAELEGGNCVEENVEIAKHILSGKGTQAHRQLVLVNAAHVLMVTPLVSSLQQGYKMASEILESGKAAKFMRRYIDVSHDV